ncbi:response regulator [Tomitella biformata]|uniref:response regulator n=1 Tax=Tomitella biformata TaxID=630403 RepID=UPI0004672914
MTASEPELRVLVYSSDALARRSVIEALGPRPHPDLPPIQHIEVATAPMVLRLLDAGGIDLVILDGEASPAGGMGIAKQLRDEIDPCPPILVLTARRDDDWLASWSRADAIASRPVDPIDLARTVIDLIRASAHA